MSRMSGVKSKLLFSCLTGYNIYIPSKSGISDRIHMFTSEEVDVREILLDTSLSVQEKWRYFIEYPVSVKHFLWPVDIVEIDKDKKGLVFKKRAFPKLEPIKKILYSPELLNWGNTNIRSLIKSLLIAFDELHSGGYAYHAFDMDKIFFNELNGEVLIDFSLAMTRHFFNRQHVDSFSTSAVQMEFLPPWSKFNEDYRLSLEDDYYSLAAMLFRLMIGRMPYQGRLMDGIGDIMDRQRDVDQGMHLKMFEHYHNNPVFIFDENDNSNSIGLYSHEEKIIDKWEGLPNEIRMMFKNVFSKDNIKRNYGNKKLYTAREWIAALEKASIISVEGKK